MFWGLNWIFCIRWCKEIVEWSFVIVLFSGVGGRRVEIGEGFFSVIEGQLGRFLGFVGYWYFSQFQFRWLFVFFRCWFYEKIVFYVIVYGYFFVIFFFSVVVLGLVVWKIFILSNVIVGKMQGLNWKGVFIVLGFSSLLGMTWGLVIFTSFGLFVIYVFVLFNFL